VGRRLVGTALVPTLLLILGVLTGPAPSQAATGNAPRLVAVRVQGNRLVDGAGAPLTLRGVDRSGMQYACVQGFGTGDGPMTQASVDAMTSWAVTAVRVPLNEDCWLGINGADPAYSGEVYRRAVAQYVSYLHRDGMVAVLDLHWNAPGAQLSTGQQPMADADHAPAFWSSVAEAFVADPGVVFDLFNEPHDITWSCWRDGCSTPGYTTAGMQALVDAVRATGARQPVMLGALGYAGAVGGPQQYGSDPTQGWLAWRPSDPAGQIAMSWHVYNFSGCATTACWDSQIAPVAALVPVVIGELGETDCGIDFATRLLDWADAHAISTLAWAWNQSSNACGDAGPSAITDYSGTPTTYGTAVRNHFLRNTSTVPPSTTPSSVTVDPTADAGVGVPAVVLRATVVPPTAGGSVAFTDGTTPIADCQARLVASGRATCVTTFTGAGPHSVAVAYSGDSDHTASSGNALVVVLAHPTLAQVVIGYLVLLAHLLHLFDL
jgi:endoglucanase